MKFTTNNDGIRIAYFEREDFIEELIKSYGDHQLPFEIVFIHKEDCMKLLGLDITKAKDWYKFYDLLLEVSTEAAELTDNYKSKLLCPSEILVQYVNSNVYDDERKKYFDKFGPRESELPVKLMFGEYINEGLYRMIKMMIDTKEGSKFRVWCAFAHLSHLSLDF